MLLDKFIPPYIAFVEKYLDISAHHFIVFADSTALKSYPIAKSPYITLINQKFRSKIARLIYIAYKLQFARKIFIHGLWIHRINIILTCMFWNLKKCHLAIWGGDLYAYRDAKSTRAEHRKERYKRFVFKHVGYIIPVVYGDYTLAKKWYHTRAKSLEPFMYVSFYERYITMPLKPQGDIVNIQVGNSATTSNHHIDCFDMLEGMANICIYVPLSYGDKHYADSIKRVGEARFGDRFVALESFMPFDTYMAFLHTIDIAIFKQNRQQGMGNIFALLAMGKKIYLDSSTTHYDFLRELGFRVFDIRDFDLNPMLEADSIHNRNLLLKLYSKEKQIASQRGFYA